MHLGLSVCLSVCLFVCLYVCLSVCQKTIASINLIFYIRRSIPVARSSSKMWSTVAQLVECRTRNRESPGSNPVVTVSKFGHFLSLHDASFDSAV